MSVFAVLLVAAIVAALPQPASSRPCLKGQLINLYGKCTGDGHAAASEHRQKPAVATLFGSDRGRWRLHRVAASRPGGGSAIILELASQPTVDSFGKVPATLIIRCRGQVTNLLIAFDGKTMSDRGEKSEIIYRLDGGPEELVELSLSKDPSVMGIWHGFRAVPLVKKLAGGSQLKMSAWDGSGERIDLAFNLSGLDRALEPVRSACRW